MTIRVNWGTGIALVYTAFATATAGFVTFAMGRPVDLVSQDYYTRSLHQDQRIAAEKNALALGSDAQIVQTDARAVLLALPRAHAAARGSVTLYRASDASADRTVEVALDARARQRVSLDGLRHGRWIVQVSWSAAGRDYYLEQPVSVP